MKGPVTRTSNVNLLSERLGQIRRMLFLLECAERLKHLRDCRLRQTPSGAYG
jgi:hypothetical protein